MIPNLALLVLVRTHCDFNKFHFDFLKKNINTSLRERFISRKNPVKVINIGFPKDESSGYFFPRFIFKGRKN